MAGDSTPGAGSAAARARGNAGQNVLLTGATGYLGQHVLKELLADDAVGMVYCTVRESPSLAPGVPAELLAELHDRVTWVRVRDMAALLPADLPDVELDRVIHLAGSVKHTWYACPELEINISGALAAEEIARAHRCPLVVASTSGVSLGSPRGDTDKEQEEVAMRKTALAYYNSKQKMEHSLTWRSTYYLRPSMMLGPEAGLLSPREAVPRALHTAHKIATGKGPVLLPRGGRPNVVDVRDVARVFARVGSGDDAAAFGAYFLGGTSLGGAVTGSAMRSFVRGLAPGRRVVWLPAWLLQGVTTLASKVPGLTAPSAVQVVMAAADWDVDSTKAKSKLGFSPRSWSETSKETRATVATMRHVPTERAEADDDDDVAASPRKRKPPTKWGRGRAALVALAGVLLVLYGVPLLCQVLFWVTRLVGWLLPMIMVIVAGCWAFMVYFARHMRAWTPEEIMALNPPPQKLPEGAPQWQRLEALIPESEEGEELKAKGGRSTCSVTLDLPMVGGALVLTGATGFIGSHLLYSLLLSSEELQISRIVLLVRNKKGMKPADRLVELGKTELFAELKGRFEAVVRAVEVDVAAELDLPMTVANIEAAAGVHTGAKLPIKALVHAAADVSFNQPMQEAATTIINGSLQMVDLAGGLSTRLVFISTAFVHSSPPEEGSSIPAKMSPLNGLNPALLYEDMLAEKSEWAHSTMRALNHPNTYTFTKAVCEHLLKARSTARGVPTIIVRPDIVGPAFAVPAAGWHPEKPSTLLWGCFNVNMGMLAASHNFQPAPLVPVDIVTRVIMQAVASPLPKETNFDIKHATFNGLTTPTFSFSEWGIKIYEYSNLLSGWSWAYGGLTSWLQDGASHNVRSAAVTVFNLYPTKFFKWLFSILDKAGVKKAMGKWWPKQLQRFVWASDMTLDLLHPTRGKFLPFACPTVPWAFASDVRTPRGYNKARYLSACMRAGFISTAHLLKTPCYAEEYDLLAGGIFGDVLLFLSRPPSVHSFSNFAVRLGLRSLGMRTTCNLPALARALQSAEAAADGNEPCPVVIAPTHRSFLDFVLLALLVDQCPILPENARKINIVADAEFGRLPFLGSILGRLGAVFLRRSPADSNQRDANLPSIANKLRTAPLSIVFVEGARSRSRRSVRPRSGMLLELQKHCDHGVHLLPCTLSYERIPEHSSLVAELEGKPRSGLSVVGLVSFMAKALCGKVKPLGSAHLDFGHSVALETTAPAASAAPPSLGAPESSDAYLMQWQQGAFEGTKRGTAGTPPPAEIPIPTTLPSALAEVQRQHVEMLRISELHVRAAADALSLPREAIRALLHEAGVPVSPTKTRFDGETCTWPLGVGVLQKLRTSLPPAWESWLIEPPTQISHPLTRFQHKVQVAPELDELLSNAVDVATTERNELLLTNKSVSAAHLVNQLTAKGIVPMIAHGAAAIALQMGGGAGPTGAPTPTEAAAKLAPIHWPKRKATLSNVEAIGRWGFDDTHLRVVNGGASDVLVKISSERYAPALEMRPLPGLWRFMQEKIGLKIPVVSNATHITLPPAPASALAPRLRELLAAEQDKAGDTEIVVEDGDERWRAGTGHSLHDVYCLRKHLPGIRCPDTVVRATSPEVVRLLLADAAVEPKYSVIPMGGGTNVTSATLPSDERTVILDLKPMKRILWVNPEDMTACVEAGITGTELQKQMKERGYTVGHEPDSMEFSTLGGWIATRASGMKRSTYGNIEDIVMRCTVVTPIGIMEEGDLDGASHDRVSTGVSSLGLALGSEGCLGVVTCAIVRIHVLPTIRYQSVVFPDWSRGCEWMREVAKLEPGCRPTSARLMDSFQAQLSSLLKPPKSTDGLKKQYLAAIGCGDLNKLAAATLLFEGKDLAAVKRQHAAVAPLVKKYGGVWGGEHTGERGYAMTYAIAYIRDFCVSHHVLAESFETSVPWSHVSRVLPLTKRAVEEAFAKTKLPGRPMFSIRMTQLYDNGCALYMYLAIYTGTLSPMNALHAFEAVELAARKGIMAAGGSLSHHHGIGKHRAPLLRQVQTGATLEALRALKRSVDPDNILGAANGAWADVPDKPTHETIAVTPKPALVLPKITASSPGGRSPSRRLKRPQAIAPPSADAGSSSAPPPVEDDDSASQKSSAGSESNAATSDSSNETPPDWGANDGTPRGGGTSGSSTSGSASPLGSPVLGDLADEFTAAADAVANTPDIDQVLSSATLLELYALYKQATNGDAAAESPYRWYQTKSVTKYNAWAALRGTGEADARARYIELVKSELP